MLSNVSFIFHLTQLMSLHYPVKQRSAKIAPFKCCVKGFPEFTTQKLLDFLKTFVTYN